MDLPGRVQVELEFGFSEDKAPDALAILISGYYMFKSLGNAPRRFRENYPEVFNSAEEQMMSDGSTRTQAEAQTIEALEQYFDLLGKMIYMLGYELADKMNVEFPVDEDEAGHRLVVDGAMSKEEVMNELSRIMNTNN
jgi:hypothetical protein